VFSKSLDAVEGNTRLSHGDPVQEVRALKEQNGGPIAVGGRCPGCEPFGARAH
jgi:hypothetical protein